MLLTIVDTKTYGKFVLHKYPYTKILEQIQGLQRIPASDMLQTLSETFDYFAIYNKKNMIPTANGPLEQGAVLALFMANQKSSQIVLGIDDDCVLVSRSAFLSYNTNAPSVQQPSFSQNAVFYERQDDCQQLVNSISLVYRLPSFEGVEQAKHRLSFLLGVLQRRQQNSQFLSKEITRIMQQKQLLRRRIKDLFTLNSKDTSHYQDIRVKILGREIECQAKRIRQKIQLFRMLVEYYQSWQKGSLFVVRQQKWNWQGTIGKGMLIGPPPHQFTQEIQHKTLVMLPPKLNELLPPSLYSDRVKRLYSTGYAFNSLSLKKVIQKSGIDQGQLYHTAYFLLRNNLAVAIYPLNHPHSYNLFYLKELPPRQLIDKFNQRIFPGKNFLQVVSPYSNFRIAKEEEQTLKYLLLKEIVGEVQIMIYRKWESRDAQELKGESYIEEMLIKYNMTQHDLNYLLSVQPLAASKDQQILQKLSKAVRENHKVWGFYFIE